MSPRECSSPVDERIPRGRSFQHRGAPFPHDIRTLRVIRQREDVDKETDTETKWIARCDARRRSLPPNPRTAAAVNATRYRPENSGRSPRRFAQIQRLIFTRSRGSCTRVPLVNAIYSLGAASRLPISQPSFADRSQPTDSSAIPHKSAA